MKNLESIRVSYDNKSYSVAISTDNSYLSLGVKYVLSTYFNTNTIVRNVESHTQNHTHIMILFLQKYDSPFICHSISNDESGDPLFIISEGAVLRRPCERMIGSISSHMRVDEVKALITRGFQLLENRVSHDTGKCIHCTSIRLTKRELEVMEYLKQACSVAHLSVCMGISDRTISAHKQSVMRKLGFRRNVELYSWLRCGGLEKIKRS
ncbi:response regulator transcription factor [Serratia fonticola]